MYILNKGKERVNSLKTPYGLWYGKTPIVQYFKVFGRKSYIRRDEEDLGKFDARSNE